MPQVLIRKMLYTLLFEALSDFKKEELQLKEKKNTEYADILRLFTSVPVHSLWPLSIYHVEACYANDYDNPFINFI